MTINLSTANRKSVTDDHKCVTHDPLEAASRLGLLALKNKIKTRKNKKKGKRLSIFEEKIGRVGLIVTH